jgi:hypothetical protein
VVSALSTPRVGAGAAPAYSPSSCFRATPPLRPAPREFKLRPVDGNGHIFKVYSCQRYLGLGFVFRFRSRSGPRVW